MSSTSSQGYIRQASACDLPDVLKLNQAEAVWTSHLTLTSLRELDAWSNLHLVVEHDGDVAGFLIVIPGDAAYPNDNLNWFKDKLDTNFWYIDRVVVDKQYAGSGFGRLLYTHAFELAAQRGIAHIVCEYSTTPMNHGSAAFHRRMGFIEIGVREDMAKGKVLSMQRYSAHQGVV